MKVTLITPTEKMFITSRAKQVLLLANINNVADLLSQSKVDLIKLPNLGKKSINDICKMLSISNLSLLNDWKTIDDYVDDTALKEKFAQNALQGLLAFHGTINDRTLVDAAYDYAEMMMEKINE